MSIVQTLKTRLIGRRGIYEWMRRAVMQWQKARYSWPHVHGSCRIVRPAVIHSSFVLGPYSFVNRGSWICANVCAGKYVMMAPDVIIAGADHPLDCPDRPMYFGERPALPETRIGDDVWIGAGARIRAGIVIGNGAVVGMGSVVTRDVPEYAIVAGVPAAPIRERFEKQADRDRHRQMLAKPARRWSKFCDDQ